MESNHCDNQLKRVWSEVYDRGFIIDLSDVSKLLESPESDDRLRGLVSMRRSIQEQGIREEFFGLAEPLIQDPNNNCRWQALILVGEFIESEPDRVWAVIEKHAQSQDEDMRTAVATVLLEHLLEQHAQYDGLVADRTRQSPLFADTLSRCAHFRRTWRRFPATE